jgi:uncharacterized membrane protein required for colicin V production
MYLDLLLLFVISFFALMGFIQGFVRQALSLAAILSIIFLAQPLVVLAKAKVSWLWIHSVPDFVMWSVVSFGILVSFMLIGIILAPIKSLPVLKPTDRWLGLSAGLIKGTIVAIFACLLLQLIPRDAKQHFNEFSADADKSVLMKGAAQVMAWDKIGSIKGLSRIRKGMNDQRAPNSPLPKPWLIRSSADRD